MADSVDFEITFPYGVAYKATLQLILHARTQFIASAIFPLVGVVLICLWVAQHHTPRVEELIILTACFLFAPLVTVFSLFFARRKNPLAQGPFRYKLDPAGIHASGEAFNSTIKWPAIRRVVETGSFLFLFISPARAISLPIAQLRAAAVFDDVREIVRKNRAAVAASHE